MKEYCEGHTAYQLCESMRSDSSQTLRQPMSDYQADRFDRLISNRPNAMQSNVDSGESILSGKVNATKKKMAFWSINSPHNHQSAESQHLIRRHIGGGAASKGCATAGIAKVSKNGLRLQDYTSSGVRARSVRFRTAEALRRRKI